MGKTIKRYHYLPILDDRNLNDQGIDASGALLGAGNGGIGTDTTVRKVAFIKVVKPDMVAEYGTLADVRNENHYDSVALYFKGEGTTADLALEEARGAFVAWALSEDIAGVRTAVTDVTADPDTSYGQIVTIGSLTDNTGGVFTNAAGTIYNAGYGLVEYRATNTSLYGNLYASSKDIGSISGKIPALSETGGKVNRVGMRRIELEGTIAKFGFYDEYTQESLDFDSDSELEMHITQEMVKAANEITEDQIQIDLLNGAGVIFYTGDASSASDLQGNDATDPFATGNTNDLLTYDTLVKLAIELDSNRCPKHTKVITGSRMVDTKVVNSARYIYIGSELLPTIMRLTDYHGNKAFIPVAQYASAGNVVRGEVGAVDNFRFIVVPEMMHWAGAGAVVTAEDTVFRNSVGASGDLKFDVFPMLVVGDQSFTTIGFQTDGKSVKFKIKHSKPGSPESYANDPYGETGFMSIKWYYGSMILRPERIAVVKTIAEW
jgi:N4-gp56 family major capsid protein